MANTEEKNNWGIESSDTLYHISRWGDGYFSINELGHLTILPHQDKGKPSIDIMDIIEEVKNEGISLPVVIRFHDILRSQVVNLNRTFRDVIEEAEYHGRYYGVYPIKVNQMREVVEEIVDAGMPFNYGLEAGSKTELLSVIAFNQNQQALTILNGHKDTELLKLALLGRKIGRNVFVVIEKFSELLSLLDLSQEMNVPPLLGIRAKLSVKGTGQWSESGGEKAKFGLTIPEILKAVNLLKETNQSDSLKLLHFHIGSQISDIRVIKDAVKEGARIYAKLVKMGMPIEYFDVGGGLGIDYDGSRSTSDSSTNYSIWNYAEDIVYNLQQICDLEDVEHPHIISESGRAVTALHSCVITKVIDTISTSFPDNPIPKKTGEHILVENMREIMELLDEENYQEIYNDALENKAEAINAFKLGILSLEERATVETIFWKIAERINTILAKSDFVPEGLSGLEYITSPQYLCNFSVFQSLPDSWAIDQLVPIVPIMRLHERPTIPCTLADITCDSDGKINRFIDMKRDRHTLLLHNLQPDQDYYIGFFLTGAYQDVMGDNHNLFGRVNEVHVFFDDSDPSFYYIEEMIPGETCENVLTAMQYNARSMASTVKKLLNRQVQRGKLLPRESVRLMDFFETCLRGYTYLKK